MPDSARYAILDLISDRIWAKFNLTSGATTKIFRARRVGPLSHFNVTPSYTVADDGKQHMDGGDNESENVVLAVRVFLHLEANWKREGEYQTWINRAESIDNCLRGRPTLGHILAIVPVRSFLDTAVFLEGASQEVFVLDYDVRYFDEVSEFDTWA
jgi:hypothetical protein